MGYSSLNKIRIFYDGDCGLCHRFVVFTLQNMREEIFVFSPQKGASFNKYKNKAKEVDQSIIIYNEENGSFFYKGNAIRFMFLYFKWPWKAIAYLLNCFPPVLLDILYDCVAKIRHKLFKKPKGSCPILPSKWMKYFDE